MAKRTRATKITDKDKAWNRNAKPRGYRLDSIPLNKIILIVCEGQTEKLYFESFPVLGINIRAIDLGGQAKLKLVEATKAIIEKGDNEYEEVWCVFDMDVRRGAEELADFDNSIESALSLAYKVAYSNDSFELWFYLHFNYTDTNNFRTFYYDHLSNKFGINYIKEGKSRSFCLNIYNLLQNVTGASQEKAIERAKLLYANQKHLPYSQQNPITKVYELVEELNRNLRR